MLSQTTVRSCECPECGATVEFPRQPLRGEVVKCVECAVELEVTETDPVGVVRAPEVQEDWGE